jgi:hypothetical protein
MFHVCTDKLYVYPCRYNYRPDHCMYMSVCKSAESQGVAVLHGSRGSFHAEKQPAFRAIYRAMEEVVTSFILLARKSSTANFCQFLNEYQNIVRMAFAPGSAIHWADL